MSELGEQLRSESFNRLAALIMAINEGIPGNVIVEHLYGTEELAGKMRVIQDIASANTVVRILTKTFVTINGGNPDETYSSGQQDSQDHDSGGVPE